MIGPAPHHAAISEHLVAAGDLLRESEALWRPAPFKEPALPWEADHPDLAAALRRLSEHELLSFEEHPARARRFLARWLPRFADRAARLEPAELDAPDGQPIDEHLAEGMPARKWEQIRAFAARVPNFDGPLLEWCSGKGHLGRLLSHLRGQPTRCVERDERLAHRGRQIAEEQDLPVDFAILDALGEAAGAEVATEQVACALHACGELHLTLLRLAAERQTRAIAISPCCYHLIPDERHHPLSQAAAACELELSRDDLRLALQETVTAAPAVRRRRDEVKTWRLGFDLLQRELRGVDAYLSVPPVSTAVVRGGFEAFMRWAAERRSVELPAKIDLARYEAAGRERLAHARRLSVLRHLFRRPLEAWLVLDRAQFLAEAGYAAEVGVFCERRMTPRNLMIRAVRR